MSGTRPSHLAARPARRRRPAVRWGQVLVPAAALLLLASACGSTSTTLSGPVVSDGIGCQPSEVARRTEAPVIPATTKVATKLGTVDEKVGTGCPTDSTSFLSFDLVGAVASTGKVFTSTFKTGHPLTTQLGKGQLVAGLETGLAGMKVGGRRMLTVPAAQAYGSAGSPEQHIGSNQPLVFVADLISVTILPVYCAAASGIPATANGKPIKGKPLTVDTPVKVPVDKVTTKALEPGKGEVVGRNRYATVDYLGISCLNGRQFDSSWDRGSHFTVALGTAVPSGSQSSPDYVGNVIPGWSSGLATARVGGLYQLDIPFPLAYGSQGQGSAIGPDAALVFVIRVISVSNKPPKSAATPTTTAPKSTTTSPKSTTTSPKTTTTSKVSGTTTTAPAGTPTTTK